MDDGQLQEWVERISRVFFGRPFLHKASFNRRLRSTGGRYFNRSHNLEFSWKQYEAYGEQELEKIIKHELCHYHLHLLRRGYKHRDRDFKQLLEKVGGSRYCRSLPGGRRSEPYRYRLECVDCHTLYPRKRKVDPRKYVCGKCKGALKLDRLDGKPQG